jgi:hypothetical protein
MWGFAHHWLAESWGYGGWTNSYDHLDNPGHRLRGRRSVARRGGATSSASLGMRRNVIMSRVRTVNWAPR